MTLGQKCFRKQLELHVYNFEAAADLVASRITGFAILIGSANQASPCCQTMPTILPERTTSKSIVHPCTGKKTSSAMCMANE
jgi:hypothetical protein